MHGSAVALGTQKYSPTHIIESIIIDYIFTKLTIGQYIVQVPIDIKNILPNTRVNFKGRGQASLFRGKIKSCFGVRWALPSGPHESIVFPNFNQFLTQKGQFTRVRGPSYHGIPKIGLLTNFCLNSGNNYIKITRIQLSRPCQKSFPWCFELQK